MNPMTVREVFYQATVRGIVEETRGRLQQGSNRPGAYAQGRFPAAQLHNVGRGARNPDRVLALALRLARDNTRWQRKPNTYDSIGEALRNTGAFYRKAFWIGADSYVEIWLEKDALSVSSTQSRMSSMCR